jgi:hypothetical protein
LRWKSSWRQCSDQRGIGTVRMPLIRALGWSGSHWGMPIGRLFVTSIGREIRRERYFARVRSSLCLSVTPTTTIGADRDRRQTSESRRIKSPTPDK